MRISDWSSDVCSSDLDLPKVFRKINRSPHLIGIEVLKKIFLMINRNVPIRNEMRRSRELPDMETIKNDQPEVIVQILENGIRVKSNYLLEKEKPEMLILRKKVRSEEHTSELRTLIRHPYTVLCLKNINKKCVK